jgi:hypothetical protein
MLALIRSADQNTLVSDPNYPNGYQRAALKASVKQEILASLSRLPGPDQLALLFEMAAEREATDAAAPDKKSPNGSDRVVSFSTQQATVRKTDIEPMAPAHKESDHPQIVPKKPFTNGLGDISISDTLLAMIASADKGMTTGEAFGELEKRHPNVTTRQYISIALRRLERDDKKLRSRVNNTNRAGRKIYFARTNGGATK